MMQSKDLVVLNFEDQPVRTRIGEDGQPLWVAVDVCRAIGIKCPERAYNRLDPDEQVMLSTHDLNGKQQEHLAVTESGLYNLILGSKQPRARAFKKWVTAEVLPSIRRTGKYEVPGKDHIIAMLESALETRKAQLELEKRQAVLETAVQTVEGLAIDARTTALAAHETVTGAGNYVALVGFCREHGLKLTEQELAAQGRRLSAYCRSNGHPVKKIPNQKFGSQNAYEREVLEKVWLPGYLNRSDDGEETS